MSHDGIRDRTGVVRLTLVPERSAVPASIRLRKLLKAALRTFGFRCIRVEDAPPDGDMDLEDPATLAASNKAPDSRTTT